MMFRSFFLGGYECATGFNVHRKWIDKIAATQHDRYVREDYALLKECGIHAVRESVRWPLVNPAAGVYDFSTVDPVLQAAKEEEIEQIFDLFHYGYPNDVDILSEAFPDRFADYCFEAARYITKRTDGQRYYTPVNEPSFFSWAAGHAGMFAPHLIDQGFGLKVQLCRAAIRGIDAIWAADPSAKIVNVDPVCRVVAPSDRPDLQPDADYFNSHAVFESFDMIGGFLKPELGGSRRHLGVVGVNYYWTNQWEIGSPEIPLGDDDERSAPLSELIETVYKRYGGEILITETSHAEERRAPYLRYVTDECVKVLERGIPLRGICLYPILGMPEWHSPEEWTRMGLWDLLPVEDRLERVLYEPMCEELKVARGRLEPLAMGSPVRARAKKRMELL
jgi:beta-glucosidase/6-phospho-beta-glucosidase/beta-galactosidase